MNIIMSRALPPNYSAHRLPPTNLSTRPQQEQQEEFHQDHHHLDTKSYLANIRHLNDSMQQSPNSPPNQRISPPQASRHSTSRLSSPLDFTDSIPFNELMLSTETLGSGSYGTVYRGRWRGLNVAVKHFRTREEIDSFSVEVKQLSRVRHPNIVKLYGASSPSRTAAYLVMEYAEGGSLNHLLHECRQQEYDLRHACSWAMQTARGVEYLHSLRPKPIMHRDLKPANLLLFSRGKILKICDFGTACAVKTQMTNNTGSASYMAPEVFSTSSYLESGDVFSWSIIFWEILVRMQPYYQEYSNLYQILWRVLQGERPREIEGCPKIIWRLITRSWDKDPKERPTMKQVAQEMEFIFSLARSTNYSGGARSSTGGRIHSHGKKVATDDGKAGSETDAITPSSCSSEEVTTPTSANKILGISDSGNLHSKCKQLVSRLIPGQRKSSAPIENEPISAKQNVAHVSPTKPESPVDALSRERRSTPSGAFIYGDHRNHRQINRFHEEHSQISHDRQQKLSESFSICSQSQHQLTTTTRLRALLRHIELLQNRYEEIQDDLRGDKKNSTTESFKEFSELKSEIENLRRIVKESGDMMLIRSSSGVTPTKQPTRQIVQQPQLGQAINDYENDNAHIIHDEQR